MGFIAVYDRIAPAANKYMAVLFNTSTTRKIVLERILRCNWQVGAVVGVLLEQELRLITARTAGTSVPIQTEEAGVSISAGIEADTGSTAVTDLSNGLVKRIFAQSEELTLANHVALEGLDYQTVWWRRPGSSGFVGRQNQGIAVKNITSSTIGTVSYIFEFRDDPA